MVGRYTAGAANLPFFPLRSYQETDLPRVNPNIRPVTSPFGNEVVYAVPPLRPDVTIVHAQRADRMGNTQIWGLLGCQREAAFAARRLIVVVEELVDAAVVRGDPCLVTGAISVMGMVELFQYFLQGGLVDVGFLGAAQLDRYGNINTTVIGDYSRPKVRLPGSGGACEIAINAREVFVLMRQSARSFVERIDFRTSPGNLGGASGRAAKGWQGKGPTVVVTDLGRYDFDPLTGEMRLAAIHPGVTLDEVRAATGWDLRVAPDLETTPDPSAEELRLIREELDPHGAYVR